MIIDRRQKEIQQQLAKVTDLIRLVVLKLDIHSDIMVDDQTQTNTNDNFKKVRKIRQTLNVARRFNQLRSTAGNKSSQFFNSNKG